MNRKAFYLGLMALGLFLLNALIYLFWKVLFDPSNFIWYKISDSRHSLLIQSLDVLFYVHYYLWFVLLNGTIAIFYFFKSSTQYKILSLLLLAMFYYGANYLIKKSVITHYTMVFMCQRVPLDIESLPIHLGGKEVLDYLVNKFQKLPEQKQRAVIKAIGELNDEAHLDFLSKYLINPINEPMLRAEAYWAIHSINTQKGQQSLANAHDLITNDSLLIFQIKQLEY
jgi:hypothetical protein